MLKDIFEEAWKAKGLPDNVVVEKKKPEKAEKEKEKAEGEAEE